jgi:hypothetical protein
MVDFDGMNKIRIDMNDGLKSTKTPAVLTERHVDQ